MKVILIVQYYRPWPWIIGKLYLKIWINQTIPSEKIKIIFSKRISIVCSSQNDSVYSVCIITDLNITNASMLNLSYKLRFQCLIRLRHIIFINLECYINLIKRDCLLQLTPISCYTIRMCITYFNMFSTSTKYYVEIKIGNARIER